MPILKSEDVNYDTIITVAIKYKQYGIGIEVNTWGIRVMLIWWHWCIHYKPSKEPLTK